jgi:hypothetical protein
MTDVSTQFMMFSTSLSQVLPLISKGRGTLIDTHIQESRWGVEPNERLLKALDSLLCKEDKALVIGQLLEIQLFPLNGILIFVDSPGVSKKKICTYNGVYW